MFTRSICLFLAVTLVNGQIPSLGYCPDYLPINEFDINKFLGKWYEAERYFTFTEVASRCVVTDYAKSNSGRIYVSNEVTNRLTGVKRIINGNLQLIGKGDLGKLNVKYATTPIPTESTLTVLDTDYDNFAVVWSCTGFGPIHAQNAWLMTRDRLPTGSILQKAYGVLDKFKFSRTFFVKTDQEGCAIAASDINAANGITSTSTIQQATGTDQRDGIVEIKSAGLVDLDILEKLGEVTAEAINKGKLDVNVGNVNKENKKNKKDIKTNIFEVKTEVVDGNGGNLKSLGIKDEGKNTVVEKNNVIQTKNADDVDLEKIDGTVAKSEDKKSEITEEKKEDKKEKNVEGEKEEKIVEKVVDKVEEMENENINEKRNENAEEKKHEKKEEKMDGSKDEKKEGKKEEMKNEQKAEMKEEKKEVMMDEKEEVMKEEKKEEMKHEKNEVIKEEKKEEMKDEKEEEMEGEKKAEMKDEKNEEIKEEKKEEQKEELKVEQKKEQKEEKKEEGKTDKKGEKKEQQETVDIKIKNENVQDVSKTEEKEGEKNDDCVENKDVNSKQEFVKKSENKEEQPLINIDKKEVAEKKEHIVNTEEKPEVLKVEKLAEINNFMEKKESLGKKEFNKKDCIKKPINTDKFKLILEKQNLVLKGYDKVPTLVSFKATEKQSQNKQVIENFDGSSSSGESSEETKPEESKGVDAEKKVISVAEHILKIKSRNNANV